MLKYMTIRRGEKRKEKRKKKEENYDMRNDSMSGSLCFASLKPRQAENSEQMKGSFEGGILAFWNLSGTDREGQTSAKAEHVDLCSTGEAPAPLGRTNSLSLIRTGYYNALRGAVPPSLRYPWMNNKNPALLAHVRPSRKPTKSANAVAASAAFTSLMLSPRLS